MRLSWNEIRARAAKLSKEWHGKGYESGDTQTFYNDFFEVFGMSRRRVASFEAPVKNLPNNKRGRIDLFWKGMLLVEQKSSGLDLAKAKQQALDYFPGLNETELPRYILACDFQRFELWDLDKGGAPLQFGLYDLPKYVSAFAFITGSIPREFKDQDKVNIKASELMGEFYDALKASGYDGHDLERLLVRLVFCLFADDTGIFPERGMLEAYIEARTSADGTDLGPKLSHIFEVLNQHEDKRQNTLDEDLRAFPYINGDLFQDRLPPVSFDSAMRKKLLEACGFNWAEISPAIFGALFQSVIDKKKRRAIGAHYTNEQNIMKVIGPLFLDDLKEELKRLKARRGTGREKALLAFQDKLAGITCFDPACGCGNFLVIAYRELRALETEVILDLTKIKHLFPEQLSKVDVNQFYGIEIEEFPSRIAETALWMMDHIMNQRLSDELGEVKLRIPLKATPTIRNADALETDWSSVLPPEQCRYILGNPPFIGSKMQTNAQRAQVHRIANLGKKKGTLDYVCCWFLKAGAYVNAASTSTSPASGRGRREAPGEGPPSIGFVATNSITQGEQVAELWPLLFNRYNLEIAFAHRTFAWGSEARGKANVHVVIIGLTPREHTPVVKRLFDYDSIKGNPTEIQVKAISPYLFDAGLLSDPHTVVFELSKVPSGKPAVIIGSQPLDFEQLILSDADRLTLISREPAVVKFIRPYMGSEEFINGSKKWIIALQAARPEEIRRMPEVVDRLEVIRAKRHASKRKQTLKIADVPTVFNVTVIPTSQFLAIPKVSSERRDYVPVGVLNPPSIPSDLLFVVEKAKPFHFGLITSRMHMAWLRFIGGRLKSDYRYSIGLVYNPFPWPDTTDADNEKTTKLANAVLAARLNHPQSTLADLYDPLTMPPDLRKAHTALDLAVDRLYRKEPFASDRARVEFLLARYEQITAPALALANKASKRTRTSPALKKSAKAKRD